MSIGYVLDLRCVYEYCTYIMLIYCEVRCELDVNFSDRQPFLPTCMFGRYHRDDRSNFALAWIDANLLINNIVI